ncbi:MAG: efflux RND transporter periplasmic adaptor subunit [Pirellulaceae bacterium]|nr:efflux RND transporter periplasmic adaptor subunit [Pirellulaceae bacterium]
MKTRLAIGLLALVCLVAAGAWLLNHNPADRELAALEAGSEAAVPTAETVVMLPEQVQAARIETQIVERRRLIDTRIVPGRLGYEASRHVEVAAPTAGVLTRVLVQPGDQVQPGQIVAWLESSEIGAARADVLRQISERDLAQRQQQFQATIHENVQRVISAINQRQDYQTLHSQLAGQTLGQFREELLAAYSKLLLTESLMDSATSLGGSGSLAGRTVRERTDQLRAAEAALAASCEQAEFDTRRLRDRAELELRDAERRLEIGKQHLASLLLTSSLMPVEGAEQTEGTPAGGEQSGGKPPADAPAAAPADATERSAWEEELGIRQQHLSLVAVRSPIGGAVEERRFAAAERVQAGDGLFVVADTSRLWVEAEVREGQWAALELQPGQRLTVTTPAFPGREFAATLKFVGRQVSTASNAIPLVAEIDNARAELRPGLFVRVALPLAAADDAVAVPASAVVQHDGVSFVFVPDKPDRFRRVNVTIGLQTPEWVEVRSGLQPGQAVVSRGAFVLKSELLLEGEEE